MKGKFLLFIIIIYALYLRVIWLDRIPPSLYTDEADQGYNAYSILNSGKDEHGQFLPVSFRSFGDWKPPMQTYLIIPFIKIMGLNEHSIRLPGALLGTGTIILTYFLILELLGKNKAKSKIALISSFIISISPWHLLESRSAMLVVIALFFLEGGVLFLIKSIQKPSYLILSAVFFVLSFYSYYGMRLIVPLTILFLFLYYRSKMKYFSKEFIISLLTGIIILLPLGISFIKNPDVLLGRARTVSIFYDQGVKLTQWKLITDDGINYNPLISRFFHNNLFMYGQKFIQEYLTHFDPKYLFFTGDNSPPFTIPGMGILYIIDGLFIIMGTVRIIKKRFPGRFIIFYWLFISFIPAALTFMVPASNRTFSAVIPYSILIGLGIYYLTSKKSERSLPIIIAVLIYAGSFSYFLHQYFYKLPLNNSYIWNYGLKEVVMKINRIEYRYDNIIFSDVNGMPYIYLLFYKKYDPLSFQKEAVRTYTADRFGFEHVESFSKYIFKSDFNWNYIKNDLMAKTLYIVPADQKSGDNYLDIINYPNGKPAYYLIAND